MKHLFLINPTAGKGNALAELEETICAAFSGQDVSILRTEYAGHAAELARAAAESGQAVRIYACGGDGTLNEVVNGAAGFGNAAITHIPIGTGNDFLKIFGPDAARFRDPAAFLEAEQAPFDVMDCNGMLSLDIVCAGLDARVAVDVHRYKALPLVSGIGAYILSLIVNVFCRPIARPMKVAVNGGQWEGDATILCVCNGRYYGGGFMPVGEAMPDDGVLDVLLVPRVSRLTFFRLVGKYAAGKYAGYPRYIYPYRTQALTFSSPELITVVLDGETIQGREFALRLSEKKVNFFYPAGASYQPR